MEGVLGDKAQIALYARVSTEEQREGQTIDSQVAELERFTRDQGWAVVGVYRDEGWSGSLLARPALDRLRDDASHGHFHAVLINDVDRLARDVTHLGILKRDLERHGLRVIFRKLPADNSPTQNLMVNVLGSFAEFERELIADRTRRGRRHKVEVRKEFLGSIAPYGFRYVKKDRATGANGRLEVNPAEAPVVRQMYAWVDDEGLSARRVVERLNRLRFPARKARPTWAKSSVLRILRSETYTGIWHYYKFESCLPTNPKNDTKYRKSLKSSRRLRGRDQWLPLALQDSLRLIPRDRWERVQNWLDRNRAFSPRNSKHSYLLKGLVRCGACGARYVGQPCHGRFYYRCLARCKRLSMIKEDDLNATVWDAVKDAILHPNLIADQSTRLHEANRKRAAEQERAAAEVEPALQQLQNEEKRLLEAYRLEILSAAHLKRELDGLNQRRVALDERQAVQRPRDRAIPSATIRRSIADYCAQAAERLDAFTPEERQRFLQLLIRDIRFQGNQIRIKGVIPVSAAGGPMKRDRDVTGPSKDSRGAIAPTTIGLRGRNVPSDNIDAADTFHVNNPNSLVPFEVIRSISPLPHSRRFRPVGSAAETSEM